jgi:hypothetical protein
MADGIFPDCGEGSAAFRKIGSPGMDTHYTPKSAWAICKLIAAARNEGFGAKPVVAKRSRNRSVYC